MRDYLDGAHLVAMRLLLRTIAFFGVDPVTALPSTSQEAPRVQHHRQLGVDGVLLRRLLRAAQGRRADRDRVGVLMRMRVVALPPQTLGPATAAPFLLVFDRCSGQQIDYLRDIAVMNTGGAAAVLVFADEIELDAVELDEPQLHQLREAIGAA